MYSDTKAYFSVVTSSYASRCFACASVKEALVAFKNLFRVSRMSVASLSLPYMVEVASPREKCINENKSSIKFMIEESGWCEAGGYVDINGGPSASRGSG